MSRTISTNTTGPVVLGTADNPLSITSTGTVASAGSAGRHRRGSGDHLDDDECRGGLLFGREWRVTGGPRHYQQHRLGLGQGCSRAPRGRQRDQQCRRVDLRSRRVGGGIGCWGGRLHHRRHGTVTNHGSISGVAYGVGLGHGGLVTNTGSISGGEDGVIIQGGIGTISNSHTIIATVDDGVALFAGGGVTNVSGASIVDHGRGASVYITGATGTVTNAGSISAVFDGVFVADGGSLSNAASGSITAQNIGVFFKNRAGTLINARKISGTGTQGTGIYLGADGSITNTSTGTITGHIFGAFIEGGFGTIVNSGSISGAPMTAWFWDLGARSRTLPALPFQVPASASMSNPERRVRSRIAASQRERNEWRRYRSRGWRHAHEQFDGIGQRGRVRGLRHRRGRNGHEQRPHRGHQKRRCRSGQRWQRNQ